MAKGNVSRTPLQRPLPEESSDEADFDPIALLLSDRNSVVSGVSFKRGENQLGPQLLIGDSDSEEEEDERTSVVVPPPQPQVKLEKIYARKPVDQLFARVMEQKRKAAGGASHSKSLLRPAVAFEGYSKSRSTTTSVPSGTASPISSIGEGQKPSTAEDIRTANRRILKQKLAAIKGGKKTSKTVTGDIPAPTNVASPPVANPLPPPPASDHDILDALLNLQPSTSAIADTANVRQPAASTFTSFNDPIDDPMAYLDQPHLVTDDQLEFLSL